VRAIAVIADIRQHLVVGLGNPGPAYASTRHNIGFMVVDRLVRKYGLIDSCSGADAGDCRRAYIAGVPLLAAKPMAYMNRSGGPVGDIVNLRDSMRGYGRHPR
jgi:PTH1 family peptidyl-tRNA hydrolase